MRPAEIKRARAAFEARLRARGNVESAASQKAYMKSALSFYGTTSAEIRGAAADYLRENPEVDLKPLVIALYETESFDLHSIACALLERRAKVLDASYLPLLIDLVRRSACWAHVDWLATKMIPPALRDARNETTLLGRWAKDKDFWVRRTSLLAQLGALKKGTGDFELFTSLAVPMLSEREFFIRKAIGWVLREVSKKYPDLVRKFVREHGEKMSGLTRREATKYL